MRSSFRISIISEKCRYLFSERTDKKISTSFSDTRLTRNVRDRDLNIKHLLMQPDLKLSQEILAYAPYQQNTRKISKAYLINGSKEVSKII